MAEQNLPIHPRERLPHIAPPVLDPSPKVDLQFSRFFITEEEFQLHINAVCFQFWKIQAFAKFVKDNNRKIIEKYLVYGDLPMFSYFLSILSTKDLSILRACFERYVASIRLNF